MRLQSTTTTKASWVVVPAVLLCLGSVVALSNASSDCGGDLTECPARLVAVNALSPLALLQGNVHANLALLGEEEEVDSDENSQRTTTSIPPTTHKQKPQPMPKPKTKTPVAHKKPSPKPKPKPKPKSNHHTDQDVPMATLIPATKEPHKSKPKPHPKHHSTTKPHEASHPHNTHPRPLPPHSSTAVISVPSPHPTESLVFGSTESGGNTPVAVTTADPGTRASQTQDPTATATGGFHTTAAVTPAPTSRTATGTEGPSPPSSTPGAVSHSTPSPVPVTTHGVITVDPRPTLLPPLSSAAATTTTVPIPAISPHSTAATTTAARTTTTAPTTTTTPAAPSPSSSGHHKTKTTAAWLPTTIEPIAPPKHTHTAPPGTSLPDVVIPDLHPDIPDNSIKVHLRLERVSYYQVITNGILAAQLVSFIPDQLCQILNVDGSLILVLAIRDGADVSSTSARKLKKRRNSDLIEAIAGDGQDRYLQEKKRTVHVLRRDMDESYLQQELSKRSLVTTDNAADAILVTVAVPQSQYWNLNTLVVNAKSPLYVPGDTLFGQFFDSTFPLSSNPPPTPSPGSGDDDGNTTANPLTGGDPGTVIPSPGGGGASTNNGPVIGSIVGLATAAYVGIALLIVRRYRDKKLKEQEAVEAAEQIKAKISAPVNVQDSSQGWGWHSS